ncbi:hAT transposon family protein, partial [Actinobacillus pleuropneumoniae]
HLAMHLLSQIASSFAAEKNWSTYSFIHSIKRNKLTSKRVEKLVVVHSALRLEHRKTPEYLKGQATRWDVDPEDDAQVDMEERPDETQMGLVGVPLS